MKSILICPGYRPAVATLAESCPLAVAPLLGETLLAYWLVHLAAHGAKTVTVLASDRPDAVRRAVGTGARWGLQVTVVSETRELSGPEARWRHGGEGEWLPAPLDVIVADHLPGLPEHRLCASYAAWFGAAKAWLDRAITPDRVGVREIAPGIKVGWHSEVPSDAMLIPPVWIGEKVFIGSGVTLGPNAIVEDRAVVETGAEIKDSIVGPETLVGTLTEVTDSLAIGDVLVNWKDGSCLHVTDEFLLCPLRPAANDASEWFRRMTQVLTGSTPPMMPGDHATLPHA